MHNQMNPIKTATRLITGAALACLLAASLSAATLLTETFNIGTSTQGSPTIHTGFWWLNNPSETPASPSGPEKVNYWKASGDGTNLGMGFNGTDTTFANAFINQRGNTALANQKWWLRDLRDGPAGSSTYSGNGTTAVHLASDQTFKAPSFTGTLYYNSSNSAATIDIAVTYSLALLNADGNGYVATLSVMNGVISFYRLDHGLSGDWGTALASSTATTRLNNFVTTTFGLNNSGTLNLTSMIGSTAGPSLTFTDNTYSEFTTIGWAALLENKNAPYVRFRNASLTGDIFTAPIPEPATWATLAALVTLGIAFIARRQFSRK